MNPDWQEGDFLFSLLHEHVDFIFYQFDQVYAINIKEKCLTIIQTTSDKAIHTF